MPSKVDFFVQTKKARFLAPLGKFFFLAGMDLGRGPIVQRLMQPFLVVEPEVSRHTTLQFRHGLIAPQVHLLVFHAVPKPFNENDV